MQCARTWWAWPSARAWPAGAVRVAPSELGAGLRRAHDFASPHGPSARGTLGGHGAREGKAAGVKSAKGWGQHRGGPPTRQQLDLNQDLHRCDSIEQILVVIERAKAQKVTLNTVNIITAVNKLAKLRTAGKRQRSEELLLVI